LRNVCGEVSFEPYDTKLQEECDKEHVMRPVNLLVIHCSATHENVDYTPEQLESDHKARGFQRAGYNFYIRRSGELATMRPLGMIPAQATGFNRHSVYQRRNFYTKIKSGEKMDTLCDSDISRWFYINSSVSYPKK